MTTWTMPKAEADEAYKEALALRDAARVALDAFRIRRKSNKPVSAHIIDLISGLVAFHQLLESNQADDDLAIDMNIILEQASDYNSYLEDVRLARGLAMLKEAKTP